ncbi:MAG: heme exporter protein CcmD [Alphaproteobacteria bacterium]
MMTAMNKLTDFLDMGQYNGYIWPVYVLAIIILLWLVVFCGWQYRKTQREYQELQELNEKKPQKL